MERPTSQHERPQMKLSRCIYMEEETMRNGVKGECVARIDDLVICSGNNVCLTCSELESVDMPRVLAHVHAERPVHSVKDNTVLGLDCRICRLRSISIVRLSDKCVACVSEIE